MGGRPWALPTLVAALAAAVYLVWDPPSADLMAQRFRADLAEREGFTLFSTAWYGGHHTPGYSVLFPLLGALLGPQLVAALGGVASVGFVGALAGRLAGLAFVPAMLASLVSGRLAFTLGLGIAAGALLAAARGRAVVAAVAGAVAALTSPVAALFAGLCGAALLSTAGLALAIAAAIPTGLLVLAFPEGGTFPFVSSSFWPTFGAAVLTAALAPREWRTVRIAAALYALVALAAFAVPTPLGGNAARLGVLAAGPVAVLALWPNRRVLLAVLALPIAYWVLQPAVRDWLRAHDDPAAEAAFYAPVAEVLERRQPARVEVPFTQSHGEAYHLARRMPIARGWERQVDRERNELFYEGRLTPERYAAWLRENAIGYVAVPLRLPMDASGEEEKTLALADPESLREIWRDERWRLFAVADPAPLADGVATLTEMKAEGFVLDARRAGTSTVRVRFTPYWELIDGEGCVEPAPGDWTRVRIDRPGRVEIGTRFAPGRVRANSPRCAE